MLIRPYVSADEADVRELHVSSHEEVEVSTVLDYFADLDRIDEVYARDGAFLWPRSRNESSAWWDCFRLSSDSAEIKRMRVRPECQRQGIARALLCELEGLARRMGISTSSSQHPGCSGESQRLYELEDINRREEAKLMATGSFLQKGPGPNGCEDESHNQQS